MVKDIKGLRHVTSMAADANTSNQFFTDKLGLRRVKTTADFDAPDVYRLYYGDEVCTPGSVMTYIGHRKAEREGDIACYVIEGGNAADTIEPEQVPQAAPPADQGAGSVHHIAFAVEDRAAQLRVREALMQPGYLVTTVTDRDYSWAIHFRAPGGVLFEIATNEPGFDRDEDTAHQGEAPKLPARYEPHRDKIEALLPPIAA